ncbi:hypothetical protein VD0004_g3170 [Verticillium dahliae]|uniref:Uncharacterized protein n=1 Tax=Verticillium dahliae TaxID=27337 RepID=A0A366NQK4_VERDA|nr:hypothetical protein VD0004_g3170 [Verticillium dahliae]PNH74815.1 hypothetical protein VD0001_g2766 [Verticillium dahliae]RBQ82620.1 hypothetical protein VDGD_00789 [Verticillium dahliae]RXG43443.1 hypothetical protein VDGE_00789 [Verticillium dahliae]
MKCQHTAILAALAGLTAAEVPQEHSHEKYLIAVNELLQLNNPFNIADSVFGFLGAAAAADGAGDVTNTDCLQQITADSAFTGAKTAGDIDGMANALIFRALERNSLSVGERSALCNETAENPEIAAISQHQDPASEGAAEENKAITLALAQQLALIGADPQLALESGTFPPGEIGDPTAAGFTCNDETDPVGCIFTENLLVPDATPEEIDAAVAEVLAEGDAAGIADGSLNDALVPICEAIGAGAGADAGVAVPPANGTAAAPPAASEAVATPVEEEEAAAGEEAATATDNNIQTFTGTLGGAAPAVVSSAANADRPFSVGDATFTTANAALSRSCAVQNNACFNAANAGQLADGTAACSAQEDDCLAAARLRKVRRNARAVTRGADGRMRFARRAPLVRRQSDFGACADPSIQFAEGLDGRAEASFGPAGDFDHGSANNVDIITSFICGQLGSRCGAGEATVAACEDGAAAASGLEGEQAAQAFNSALGL